MVQRDSDVNKDVAGSRTEAMSRFAELSLGTGSSLMPQFQTSYIPRVFSLSLPWCVGGPDFPRQPRWRRQFNDAPFLSLDAFTAMTASRCEFQMRADWDLNPGLWSLSFASKVNLGVSMSIMRALRRGSDAEHKDLDIGDATARIYKFLWQGEYMDSSGRRMKMNGDVSKISHIIGLSATGKALIQNYHFMSSRIAGTRQIKNSIRHIVFSSRVFYGTPVFVTFIPSERHSGLAIRLSRGRRSDPAYTGSAQIFKEWIGYDAPSLIPEET